MGQLSAEMVQDHLKDILDELAHGSIRFVSHENSYDEYECKHCGASIKWDSNNAIEHQANCIHIKAWQLLDNYDSIIF